MPAAPSALSQFLASVERRAFKHAAYAVRDDDTALDIVQEAMMRLAERYADKPQEEWPMLFQRILQNAIRDHMRRQKVRNWWVTLFSSFRKDDDEDGSDPLDWLPDQPQAANPEYERIQAQTMALIEAGVARLPARQREAFLLRYWEEFDTAETARIMGCSEGSVKTHCSRATQALADWMRQHGINWQQTEPTGGDHG